MQVDIIADEACHCGEGPIWHMAQQRLYWQDSTTGRLFRYDPATDTHEQVLKMDYIGATTVQADGSMLIFGWGCAVLRLCGDKLSPFLDPIPGETRFNDVAADPRGRVFAGAMPAEGPGNIDETGKPIKLGRLYRFDTDLSVRSVEEGIGCANGIGYSLDNKTMYYVDSHAHSIDAFDYDIDTGNIANRRKLAPVEAPLVPDGQTVDEEGCIWLAVWEGGCVKRFSPTGELLQTIELPTPLTTSVMFGGPNLDELYITSAGGNDKANRGPHAGALFRIRPGVKGRPENLSRLGL